MATTEVAGLTLADQLHQRADDLRSYAGRLDDMAAEMEAVDIPPLLRKVAEANRDAPPGSIAVWARNVAVGDDVWHDNDWWRVSATGDRARSESPFPCNDPEARPFLLTHFVTQDTALVWPRGDDRVHVRYLFEEGPREAQHALENGGL